MSETSNNDTPHYQLSKIGLDYAYLEALTSIKDLLDDHFKSENNP